MKRRICLLCVLASSVMFASCGGKTDEVSQKIIDDINAIGTVELDDAELITKTLERYNTLTDKQKEQVTNYSVLLDAEDELETLKKNESDASEENNNELSSDNEALEIERKYYDDISVAINEVVDMCTYPDTIVIKDIYYYSDAPKKEVYINFSANDSTGNPENNYVVVSLNPLIGRSTSSDQYEFWREYATGDSVLLTCKIGNDFYADSKDMKEFAFVVDLGDYQNYQ